MSDGEKEMMDLDGETMELRKYLLGAEADETVLAGIELRLLADGNFADEVATIENDLIEDFLDDDLNAEESDRFLNHFLASPERKERLKLTKDLRKYSANADAASREIPSRSYRVPQQHHFPWKALGGAFGVLLAVFGIWWFSAKQSDTDRGLAEMRKAYAGTRPIEARISAFPNYIPYSETRGPAAAVSDVAAHERAERYLQDATRETSGSKPYQALGLLYLSDKKFDLAFQEFERALSISPNDASLQSDVGATYLALARNTDSENERAKVFESLKESLKHLELAIGLAPNMPEPRFNKALCLEALKMPEQARSAWREYLERDSQTKWADEARRRLAALDAGPKPESSSEEIER
ncbi:MAG: hypothetical protein ABJA02_08685 [Acidobacteriota bacterium]